MTVDRANSGLEGLEAPHNTRAAVALTGCGIGGPSQVATELIALLRSSQPIDFEVRLLIAEALERGLFGMRSSERNEFGQLMPRLVVEGMGRDGRVSAAIATRRNWLDAVEELFRRRSSGEKGVALTIEVGRSYDLGLEAMRRDAIPFRNKMLKVISESGNEYAAEVCTIEGIPENEFDLTNEDHFYLARSIFIERDAEASVKGI